MKNLITSLCLMLFAFGVAQAQTVKDKMDTAEINSFSVKVEVDSAEDLESTFKIKDIEDALEILENGQDISLEIICNGEKMTNGINSSLGLKIKGNTDKKEEFLVLAKKIRSAALNHYNKK
jgi:hypothetical protein